MGRLSRTKLIDNLKVVHIDVMCCSQFTKEEIIERVENMLYKDLCKEWALFK